MPLTPRQRKFVKEYLRCLNASEAARRAGYTGQANVVGPRLLANVSIKKIVDEHFAKMRMDTEEVVARLSEQARADYSAYLKPDGSVDLEALIDNGKAHLIKRTKWDRHNNLIVEFYDSQTALAHVAKALGAFQDRLDITSGGEKISGLTDEERAERLAELLDAARARRDGSAPDADA